MYEKKRETYQVEGSMLEEETPEKKDNMRKSKR